MWCFMCAGRKHTNKTVLGQLNYTYTNNHTSYTTSNGPIELLKNPIIFWRSNYYYQVVVLCMPGRERILYINSNQVSLATAKQYSTGAITYSMYYTLLSRFILITKVKLITKQLAIMHQ